MRVDQRKHTIRRWSLRNGMDVMAIIVNMRRYGAIRRKSRRLHVYNTIGSYQGCDGVLEQRFIVVEILLHFGT